MNRVTSMVDGVGTNAYTYDSVGQLLSEGGLWPQDTVSYSYANRLRMGMSIQEPSATPWVQDYSYDLADRLVTNETPAGTFTYNYGVIGLDPWVPAGYDCQPGNLVYSLTLPNGAYIS